MEVSVTGARKHRASLALQMFAGSNGSWYLTQYCTVVEHSMVTASISKAHRELYFNLGDSAVGIVFISCQGRILRPRTLNLLHDSQAFGKKVYYAV